MVFPRVALSPKGPTGCVGIVIVEMCFILHFVVGKVCAGPGPHDQYAQHLTAVSNRYAEKTMARLSAGLLSEFPSQWFGDMIRIDGFSGLGHATDKTLAEAKLHVPDHSRSKTAGSHDDMAAPTPGVETRGPPASSSPRPCVLRNHRNAHPRHALLHSGGSAGPGHRQYRTEGKGLSCGNANRFLGSLPAS